MLKQLVGSDVPQTDGSIGCRSGDDDARRMPGYVGHQTGRGALSGEGVNAAVGGGSRPQLHGLVITTLTW